MQTPQSVRSLFRDPCVRVAGEVRKVLDELARSIRNRRHCSPDVLSDHLHEALHDLNSAIKSQPRLFLSSKSACRAAAERRPAAEKSATTLPSARSDITFVMAPEWRGGKRAAADQPPPVKELKTLRPTLSKIAMTSLEFSEALPFAAFASLLVEMVARLELVIEEVEELSRAANFKEFSQQDQIAIEMEREEKERAAAVKDFHSHVVWRHSAAD